MPDDQLFEIAPHMTGPNGAPITVTHHVRTHAVGGGYFPVSMQSAWDAGCRAQLVAMLPTNYTLDFLRVREINERLQPQAAATDYPINVGGGRGLGEALAEWLVIRATYHTPYAGRQNRGANLFPGGEESDVGGETISTTAGGWHALTKAYIDALRATFNDPDTAGKLVVFSRTRWRATGGSPVTWTHDVTSYVLHTSLRSLRSRRQSVA